MCGIFGVCAYGKLTKRAEIVAMLLKGLKRLEYRGYDSAGIAIEGEKFGTTHVIKSKGKIAALEKAVNDAHLDLSGEFRDMVAIAHTRWATHGPPSDVNAHPHSSNQDNSFVVVHNGIFTNYKPVKQMLVNNGYTFLSETDTEVIAVLFEYIYKESIKEDVEPPIFADLMAKVMPLLDGAFAICVKSVLYPGEMVAAKRGSPLIMGILSEDPVVQDFKVEELIYDLEGQSNLERLRKDEKRAMNRQLKRKSLFRNRSRIDDAGEAKAAVASASLASLESYTAEPEVAGKTVSYFLASDASALIEHTKQVIYFEDNDYVHLVDGNFSIFKYIPAGPSQPQNRTVMSLEMELDQIMKGSFDHFMLKEIFEQPESVVNTMRGRVDFDDFTVTLGGLIDHMDVIRNCRRLVFVGCGTSYHAALATRICVERFTRLPVSIELASDLLDRQPPIFRDDCCIFISQSGETADSLNALNYCQSRGALLMGITNTVGSSIARLTDCGVHINAGVEIGVASTKAYTSQFIAIVLFSMMFAEDSRSLLEVRKTILGDLNQLSAKLSNVLKLDPTIKQLAQDLFNEKSLLIMGRGYQMATCLEAALKVKEIPYMHSEGILAGELKHGPLALIDDTMPVIIIATQDMAYERTMNAVHQVKARKGNPIVIANEGDVEVAKLVDPSKIIYVPTLCSELQAIVNIVPFQLLSYHLAVLRGYNVDQPRNLAKSVTVE